MPLCGAGGPGRPGRVEPQFEGHKECAVFMGNSKEDVECLCE